MPFFIPITEQMQRKSKNGRADFDWGFKSSMQPDSLDARRAKRGRVQKFFAFYASLIGGSKRVMTWSNDSDKKCSGARLYIIPEQLPREYFAE